MERTHKHEHMCYNKSRTVWDPVYMREIHCSQYIPLLGPKQGYIYIYFFLGGGARMYWVPSFSPSPPFYNILGNNKRKKTCHDITNFIEIIKEKKNQNA